MYPGNGKGGGAVGCDPGRVTLVLEQDAEH